MGTDNTGVSAGQQQETPPRAGNQFLFSLSCSAPQCDPHFGFPTVPSLPGVQQQGWVLNSYTLYTTSCPLSRCTQGLPVPLAAAKSSTSTPMIPNFSFAAQSKHKLGPCGAADKPMLEVAPTPKMTQKPAHSLLTSLLHYSPQKPKASPAAQHQTMCHSELDNWFFLPTSDPGQTSSGTETCRLLPWLPAATSDIFPALFATPGRGNSLAKVLTSLGTGLCPASPLPGHPASPASPPHSAEAGLPSVCQSQELRLCLQGSPAPALWQPD